MKITTDILLSTFTDIETEAVLREFRIDPQKALKSVGGRQYWDVGTFMNSRVMLTRSGMGTSGVNGAQTNLDRAIRDLSPRAIIALGIAFGADEKKQKIGTVLISSQLILYEMQKLTSSDSGGKPKIALRGDRPPASPILINAFSASHFSWPQKQNGVCFGPLLTGEKLIDNRDFLVELLQLTGGEAIGGEMEAGGVYVASHSTAMHGDVEHPVHWIVAKAICDWGHDKAANKTSRQEKAACSAASLVKHTLTTCDLSMAWKNRIETTENRHPLPTTKAREPIDANSDTIQLHVDLHTSNPNPTIQDLEILAYKIQTKSVQNSKVKISVTTDEINDLANRLTQSDSDTCTALDRAKLELQYAKANEIRSSLEKAIQLMVERKGPKAFYSNASDHAKAIFELIRLVRASISHLSEPINGHQFDFFYKINPHFSLRIQLSDKWVTDFLEKEQFPKEGWNQLLTGYFGLNIFDLPSDYVTSYLIPKFAFAVGFRFDLSEFSENEIDNFYDLGNWTYGIA